MDEDKEWDRLITSKAKVETLLDFITENAESDDVLGTDEEYAAKLKEDLKNAQDCLDDSSVRNEETKKAEIEVLDDDDDDLFGDEEDEDDEKKKVRLQKINLYIY